MESEWLEFELLVAWYVDLHNSNGYGGLYVYIQSDA